MLRGERGKLGGGPGNRAEIGPLERVALDRERDEPLTEMHDVVPGRRDGREPRESLARLASAAAAETGLLHRAGSVQDPEIGDRILCRGR